MQSQQRDGVEVEVEGAAILVEVFEIAHDELALHKRKLTGWWWAGTRRALTSRQTNPVISARRMPVTVTAGSAGIGSDCKQGSGSVCYAAAPGRGFQ